MSTLDKGTLETVEGILHSHEAPILGVCFRHQLIAKLLGGEIQGECNGYGNTKIKVLREDPLFNGWDRTKQVWMSHGEWVSSLPENSALQILAVSESGYIAAFKAIVNSRPIYGVQFHPEVSHTLKGSILLNNLLNIARVSKSWNTQLYYDIIMTHLYEKAKSWSKALVAVGGGIDSTVSAVLARKAFKGKLLPVLVDHGLFRESELEEIPSNLGKIGLQPVIIDAKDRFLAKLEGIEDCETRRHIVGEEFAKIFAEIIKI